MSIFPYIYFMIEDFHITENKNEISFYAGMVTSAFTFAEFSTGVLWGRLSDKIGRKPVLLTGLAGTALSVLIFGFAPNLTVALIARALGGLLNGNIGVLQTTVAELVTVKEHQPIARAYTIMPLVWCLGSIAGPMIGGALARPCQRYPSIFAPGSIWDRFPYLLPNLFSAVAVCCGVVIGLLFLEETHEDKKMRRDPGLRLGKALVRLLSRSNRNDVPKGKGDDETDSLLSHEEQLPRYRTTENSPYLGSTQVTDIEAQPLLDAIERFPTHETLDEGLGRAELGGESLTVEASRHTRITKKGEQKTFTRPVILNIISYGILAFHTMTFDQLFPVFLSTEPPAHPARRMLPFKFVDGFGLDASQVGLILSVQGVYSLFSTVVLFPWVVRRVGDLRLFKLLAMSYFALYLLTPYLVLLPESLHTVGIYAIIIWKCTFSTMAYPSNAILLTNSAPSHKTLGTINGVAASTASLCRAFGPTISGLLYAAGLTTGYSGLAWWCSGLVTIAGAFISLRLRESKGRLDEKTEDDEARHVSDEVGATVS
ncbi:Major facilitator superfamily transporter [Pleurostoma richardsiae]|uniref:Major facilitator superfamily transporter n=1 Tax=Pleurostoma richardsiae TaxID=41990 RepID=A0AA38R9I3_9PEZI|nr:Major facilitator superfamily transporter [Pleurostoma richardsiae]